MGLMSDDAFLPREAEQAGEEAVRDGKAADEGHGEGNRQPEIDDDRSRPTGVPRAPAQRGKPFPVPHEVKQHENAHDDAQRLVQRLRQHLKSHEKDEQYKEKPVQNDPFHIVLP